MPVWNIKRTRICNPFTQSRDLGLADIYQRTWKIVSFYCRATTSVHLVIENNLVETKVQLNTSICLY